MFENGDFFAVFKKQKKYTSLRSVFVSFSPLHKKTLKRCKYISTLTGHARSIRNIIVFENLLFRPSTRKRKASVFKNLHFENIRFAVLGQTGGKMFVFNQKRIRVDEM